MDIASNQSRRSSVFTNQSYSPDSDVLTSFVLPTIGFCIAIIIAMLCGIHKIKEWELEKIIETRRKRRVVQRITKCLREKNLQTLERLRKLKQRRVTITSTATAKKSSDTLTEVVVDECQPPHYTQQPPYHGIDSPPPGYDEALLQEFLQECQNHRIPTYTDCFFR
uniref:Uncharacterized protein n=1 Tax=Syphacia muris TaxID=451379 RepID=A0A0N5AYM6_9BILA